MPNPYIIIGVLLAFIGVAIGAEHFGHSRGVNDQKVADQAEFDRINAGLAKQKAEANEKYRKAQDENLALVLERDTLKTRLEKERQDARKATDDLRTKYAGMGLRFKSAEGAGDRGDGSRSEAAGSNPAGTAAAAVTQLPEQIAADLRRLAFDADTLRDDYATCYGYANAVR